ncbi:MAG: alpha/beta hydrolase [Pirellulaceae bacterium]
MRLITTITAFIFVSHACLAESPKATPVSLWSGKAPQGNGEFKEEDALLTVYRPEKPNGTAAIICPGGSYGGLAIEPEGHGIARWLNKHGITGFVLQYRLPTGRNAVPLLDVQRAIAFTRENARQYGLKKNQIGVIGFSAGGHLASTAATHFTADLHRPDFAILVYPVITMGEHGHAASRKNLLGANPDANLISKYSNQLNVTADTPPVFLAHALDDKPVPPENSKLFHQACRKVGIPSKLLLLESGGHGLNGYKGPSWDAWQSQSIDWLRELKLTK